ncbi:MAG TPA: imidazolonepropionase [Candidatus Thermoplasmatota archaeon]|nr:imidazolonepropionase [Candidatus Thermoplasmatota archaeon]
MAARADLLVVNAAEVLTLAGHEGARSGDDQQDLGLVRRGGVAIRDGRIVAVGTMAQLKGIRAKRTLDARGRVVMPGFVDAHTHLVFAGSREREVERKVAGMSYQDIAREGGGILKTVEDTRKASKAELLAQARARLDRMLLAGTTTAEAKSGYALEPDGEVRLLEVIAELGREHPLSLVPTFLGAHAVPPGEDAEQYLNDLIEHALPVIERRKLARFCDVFVEQGYFSAPQGRRLLRTAAKHGLRSKVHADELSRCGGAELAVEVGAASADHLLKASERGLRELARARIPAVLLPCTPWASMMKGMADARTMIQHGVPVALGTDLSPNAWCESMALACQLAVYGMGLLPSEALVAATINAANAIGAQDEVGSLEVGKRADLLILDAPTWHHVAYRLGANLVDTVIVGGQVVVEGGQRVATKPNRARPRRA